MLDRDDYREGWKKKEAWYAANGYIEDKNLFTSTEGQGRGGSGGGSRQEGT